MIKVEAESRDTKFSLKDQIERSIAEPNKDSNLGKLVESLQKNANKLAKRNLVLTSLSVRSHDKWNF